MKPIKVEITDNEIIDMPSCNIEPIIISKLKDAGIPIIGTLCFSGIKSGVLKREKDFEKRSTIYTWSE